MTKISEEEANKTRLIHKMAQQSQGDSPSPPEPRPGDMADSMNWTMKYVLVPLIPFLIGALIRLLENGIAWSVLKPVQLTFALAMFCLFVYVSASRLDHSKFKETIQSIYVLGMAFFIALFTYATVLDSQLSGIHNRTIEKLIEAAEAEKLVPKEMIKQYAQQDMINHINETNTKVILLSLMGGIVFVGFGVGLRYSYRIGDEK